MSQTTDRNYQTQTYHDVSEAKHAVQHLHALGYARSDITVIMNGSAREKEFNVLGNRKMSNAAAAGAVVGGGLAAVAAIVMTGGVGAVALASLGGGAAAGGLVGAVFGIGSSEREARAYDATIARGGIVVGVHPRPGETPLSAATAPPPA